LIFTVLGELYQCVPNTYQNFCLKLVHCYNI